MPRKFFILLNCSIRLKLTTKMWPRQTRQLARETNGSRIIVRSSVCLLWRLGGNHLYFTNMRRFAPLLYYWGCVQ